MGGEWLIYTLLVLGIIILIVFIVRLSFPQFYKSRTDVKEGMIDYYTIEDYLKSLPLTTGRYIFIYGAQQLQISQVQVLDMNGTNIAIGKAVVESSTPQRGSGLVRLTVDGVTLPRSGLQSVWTSSKDAIGKWLLDLGDTYQISSVIYNGMTPNIPQVSAAMLQAYASNPNGLDPEFVNPQGIKVEVWKTYPSIESDGYEQQQTIVGNGITQTISFPNAINLTESVTDSSIDTVAANLLPLNSPQPEVYRIVGNFTHVTAAKQCNINGAQLATLGQFINAAKAGALWYAPGWLKDDVVNGYTPTSTNSPWYNTINRSGPTGSANAICFGVKPLQEINSAIQNFNPTQWSQYTTKPKYSGSTTYTMVNVQSIIDYVSTIYINTLTPDVWGSEKMNIMEKSKTVADAGIGTNSKFIPAAFDTNMETLFSTLKVTNQLNFLLESSLGYGYKQYADTSTTINIFGTLPPGAVDEMNQNISICKRIYLGSPLQIELFVNVSYGLTVNDFKPYIRSDVGPIGDYRNPPNFCRPELSQEYSETRMDYTTNIKYDNQAYNRANCNVELTPTMMGLIPDTARKFLIKWIFDRKKRMMRQNYPSLRITGISADKKTLTYTNRHIWRTISASSYKNAGGDFPPRPQPEGSVPKKNADGTPILPLQSPTTSRPTTSEAIILPIGAAVPQMVQTLVGMKIYGIAVPESNLTIVSYTGDQATGTITLSEPTTLTLPSGQGVDPVVMVSTVNNEELDAVRYIVPVTTEIDVTNEYMLNAIAQGFYEAMGGNYIMSNIYDIYSIGTTIIDIRFDLTKHADIADYTTKLTHFKETYYTLRYSNVSQDIIDTAKSNYETAITNMEAANQLNILPAVTGMVGRFFYKYDSTTAAISITGFTLDARAVTSFMTQTNCGMTISTGSSTGSLNFQPTVIYTKNIPEAIDCNNTKTLRRIMDDYLDAANADLAPILASAKPPVDVTSGTLHVNEIIGSSQVSPTQCAITWKEYLWDDSTNKILKDTREITRSGLVSYSVNMDDWFATKTSFDISGFAFFENANIPECIFNSQDYKALVSPRLDTTTDETVIRDDFLNNYYNNGRGQPCHKTLPLYQFNAADYAETNPSVKRIYNSSGTQGVIDYYRTTGIHQGDMVLYSDPITPLTEPIIIQKAVPAASTLDTGSDICPAADCENLNILYSLVDQYNSDPTQPGSIMRVTRAFTASPFQCDIEVDINYDVDVQNGAGEHVKKGSFAYDSNGAEIPGTARLLTGVKKKETRALSVSVNTEDCSYKLVSTDEPGSGSTILPNLPNLYKPMEYGTQFQETTTALLENSFNDVKDAVLDAASMATSVLSTYRKQGIAAVGNISNLGTCPSVRCSDTANLNAMISYYNSNTPPRTKQINTILRVGTLDSSTCDITFQEDIIGQGSTPNTYKIESSTTSGLRFTMGPGANPCTFTPTSMSSILPAAPPDATLNMKTVPSSAICPEVYGVSGTFTTPADAAAKCSSYGGTLATMRQLKASQGSGADWCSPGFVADISGSLYYPSCGTATAGVVKAKVVVGGAVCFGDKPGYVARTDVLPFKTTPRTWRQPDACYSSPTTPYMNSQKQVSGFTNYVNPAREVQASPSYETSIRVSESTFPLNSQGFGLDTARNRDAPPLENLYKEPLRQTTKPAQAPSRSGPMDLNAAEEAGRRPGSYKYLRFKPIKTRDHLNPTVEVGKFRFFLGNSSIDMSRVKVTNPMGTWIGDIEDVTGSGYTVGWSDLHKKAIVFAFPYATLVNGFSWTTANPDKGLGGDPVQWKLEGSQNGVYWTVLRDQTHHNFPVTVSRFQELPVFRF